MSEYIHQPKNIEKWAKQNERTRSSRKTNRERINAYQREYLRRRRAALKAVQ